MEPSLIKKKLLRNIRLFSLCLLYLIFFIPWLNAQQLEWQTESDKVPVVYFTSDISSRGLLKVYKGNFRKSGDKGIFWRSWRTVP